MRIYGGQYTNSGSNHGYWFTFKESASLWSAATCRRGFAQKVLNRGRTCAKVTNRGLPPHSAEWLCLSENDVRRTLFPEAEPRKTSGEGQRKAIGFPHCAAESRN